MAVQTGYGNATVDFLCCVPRVITQEMVGLRFGEFVGIEAKSLDSQAPGGTARQRQVMARIIASGGRAFVANSGEEVENQLTK